jgi:FlaA1/EpsC-like NDP-sugar epimerase
LLNVERMTYDLFMEVTYENVIGRKESNLKVDITLRDFFSAERMLITGAGGSIGSKIASSIAQFPHIEMLATDRDENRLHSLSLEIMGTALFNSSQYRVLDVRDSTGVENMITDFQPTMIVHAAALKHLAILEKQPREAYLTNFLGTRNLLKSAASHGVSKFLNISTDKAANPVSVLGKTKYMAEVLTADFRRSGFHQYTNVRFGNVFNSQGSVIETFTRQIKLGLPITLTDPEVNRFFMKIEEAANLSLLASALNEGDVHILDMGEPVKLLDVIKKLKEILDGNSEIVIVGLREGEKIQEELWSSQERVWQTKAKGIKALDLVISGQLPKDYSENPLTDEEAEVEIDRFMVGSQVGM